MANVLVGADIELVLLEHLRETLPGVRVARTVPVTLPATLVTVRRTGGLPMNPVMDQARVDIMVYAPTDLAVTALALKVQALIGAMNDGPVSGATVSGPADLGGPTPRRYMFADVRVARSALNI